MKDAFRTWMAARTQALKRERPPRSKKRMLAHCTKRMARAAAAAETQAERDRTKGLKARFLRTTTGEVSPLSLVHVE